MPTKHCDKHGDYEPLYYDGFGISYESDCPLCVEEYEIEEARNQAIDIDYQSIERAKSMNIRPEFQRASFDNFIANTDRLSSALERTKQLVKGELLSLVYAGSCGTGKTHLACAALNTKGSGRIMTMYEISATIRASFTARATMTELEIVNELASVPLLVIDEIGRSKGSESEFSWLSYIIDKRHSSYLGTILISNKHFGADCPSHGCSDCVENYFGADIISRIGQKGYMIRFEGEDFRKRKPVDKTEAKV